MNRLLLATVIGSAVVLGVGVAATMAVREEGPVFIASNGAVREDQIRQKRTSDGWTNIQVATEGRYFEVIATKDQRAQHFAVDSQTGRLRGEEDDD